jgi:hypothetical protein
MDQTTILAMVAFQATALFCEHSLDHGINDDNPDNEESYDANFVLAAEHNDYYQNHTDVMCID